jgi:hypothetical protein
VALPQAIWFFLLGALAVRRAVEPEPLPDDLVSLDTLEGAALLAGAEGRASYAALDRHFVAQIRPTFCGPATIAILVNALHAESGSGVTRLRPVDQRNVFTPEVERLRSRRSVERVGMPLAIFAEALAAHGFDVAVHHAHETEPDAFRCVAAATLATGERFVAVNYLRTALGQTGAGHISPVAAYNAESDRFLILDVSRRRYPPVWVETRALFDAMIPPGGGRPSRGFVIVGR